MKNDPLKATHRLPFLVCRAVQVMVMGCGASVAQAQTNSDRVLPEVDSALEFCDPGSINAAVCAFEVSNPGRMSLAPDKFVMLSSSSLTAMALQTEQLEGRLSQLRAAGLGSGSAMAFGTGEELALPAAVARMGFSVGVGQGSGGSSIAASRWGTFIRVEGDRHNDDPTAFDPGFKRRGTALTLGTDYRIRTDTVVGAALGVRSSRSSIDISGGASYSTVSERGTSISLYGSYFPMVSAYVDAIAAIGRGHYNVRRDIFGVGLDTAVSETSSNEQALSIGAGYAFAGSRWNWGPYGRLSFSRSTVHGFTERPNPTGSQLAVAEQNSTSLLSSLGAQVSYVVSQPWGVLVPNARLEWNRQFRRDKTESILARFADPNAAAAATMELQTTPVDRNRFTLDFGVAAHFGVGRSGVLNYSTVLGRAGQSSHVVTAGLRLEF